MPKRVSQKFYEALSFQKDCTPSYNKLVKLFIDEGLFINNKGNIPHINPIEKHINLIKKNISEENILSLSESEIDVSIYLFGNIGNIVSYYKLEVENHLALEIRYGINLFQIIKKDEKWFISSLCWDDREDKSLWIKN